MSQMEVMAYGRMPLELTSPTSPSAMYGSELDLELASLLSSLSIQHKMSNHGHGQARVNEDLHPSGERRSGADGMGSQDISMDGETETSVSMSDTLDSSSSSDGTYSQPQHPTNTTQTPAVTDNTAPSAPTPAQAYPAPCPLLQSIITHLAPGADPSAPPPNNNNSHTTTTPTGTTSLSTTSGEYLDLIFMHREMFSAHPSGHVGCPAAFTALARELEGRAWRSDREGDLEAVKAFRHEAWMTAAWLGSGGMWWGNTGGAGAGASASAAASTTTQWESEAGMGRGIGLLED